MKAPKPLSERHRRFVEAFMGKAAGNATEAARLAGYKGNAKVRAETGRKVLARPDVQAAIAERTKTDPSVMDREERQRMWTAIARGEATLTVMKHGRTFKVPWPPNEQMNAMKLLGKTQGDFIQIVKHEVGGEVRVKHVTELPPLDAPPDPGADA